MKMADIEKKVAARDKEMQTLAKAQEELAAKIEAEQKAAKEAAAAGDREAFGQHQTEAQALQADLEFSKTRLQALKGQPAITREEAKSAWENYRSKYDSDMKAGLGYYQDIKEGLLEHYKLLLDKQAEMIRERDKLARLAGIKAAPPETGLRLHEYLRVIFPATTIPNKAVKTGHYLDDPDALFFMADHAATVGSVGLPGADPFVDYMLSVISSQTFNP